MRALTILMLSGCVENEGPIFAVRLAEAALSKGYNVNIFCYGNGVANVKKNQSPKTSTVNIGEELKKLAEKTNVATCHVSSLARGITQEEYIENVKMDSTAHAFCDFLLSSDVVIVL